MARTTSETEEDTFRKLKQIPINDVIDRVWKSMTYINGPDIIDILKECGWTVEEYNSAIVVRPEPYGWGPNHLFNVAK